MGLGLGIMPRVKDLWGRRVMRPIRRAWWRRRVNGKVVLGDSLLPDGSPVDFPPDWIFIDWRDADYSVDLVKHPELPFGDGTQRIIYSAHLIEHIPEPKLADLLRECRRVLAPGGRIRLECPDAEKLMDLYRNSDPQMLGYFREARRELIVARGLGERYLEDHLSLLGELSNYIIPGHSFHMPVYTPRREFEEKLNSLGLDEFAAWCISLQTPEQRRSGGHQNALYFAKLKAMLEEAGFTDVVRASPESTTIPGLRLNADGAFNVRTKPRRRFYSLYVEATRPAGSQAGDGG